MVSMGTICRRAVGLAGTVALTASLSLSLSGQAVADQQSTSTTTTFGTIAEMMRAPDVAGTVTTTGDEAPDDGAGMTYTVAGELPAGNLGNIAIPLANGKFAVPQGIPTEAPRPYDASAFEELSARAQTFADAGTSLIWDASRPSPLTGQNVHSTQSSPYPVTCSSFIGMVVAGWDYQHTTYVADENTRVGRWVDFGKSIDEYKNLDANGLASWFYANGDLWLDKGDSYQPGDILFFSEQGNGGQSSSGDKTFFGNVYHAAIYLGDGEVIHSTGTASGAGVHRQKLPESLKADLSFVARPQWQGGGQAADSGSAQGAAAPAASAEAADSTSSTSSTSADSTAASSGSSSAASEAEPAAAAGAQQSGQQDKAAAAPAADERGGATTGAAVADPPRSGGAGGDGQQRLPVTGFSSTGLLLLGGSVALMVAGLAILIVSLRRRRRT